MMKSTQEEAVRFDQQDILSKYRNEFYLIPNQIYLDGNSLGLCSIRAEKTFLETFESWKRDQIDGWSSGEYPWFYLAEMLGAKMAPLVGAKKEEVIATGTTTVNLHQLIATFYHPEGKRTKIIANDLDFPSDIYAIKSQLQLHGLDPEEHFLSVKSRQGRYIDEEDIIACMQDDVTLMILPTVLYRSGQLLDIERLTREAHQRGILIGLDACHSVGAVPHHFHQWGVDFAVWCSYKYLNSGPGSVAAIYVHEKHFGTVPGLAGWFGSDKERQFDMSHVFEPSRQAGAYQLSAPSILNAAPLIGSLSMFEEIGMGSIREKSLSLTRYMMLLIEEELQGWGFVIGNPTEDHRRGGHISLEHEEATRICKALKEANVIPDFRAPNVIRLAPIALYTSYQDVWEAVQRLKSIMVEGKHKVYSHERGVIA
ncbi:kynureninase [Baia soyae]